MSGFVAMHGTFVLFGMKQMDSYTFYTCTSIHVHLYKLCNPGKCMHQDISGMLSNYKHYVLGIVHVHAGLHTEKFGRGGQKPNFRKMGGGGQAGWCSREVSDFLDCRISQSAALLGT